MKIPSPHKVERIEWAASTLKTRDIPRGVFKGLILNMVLTVTNGSSPALTAFQLASQVISQLSLTVNGQDTILNIPFYHLYFQNYFESSLEPENTIDTTASSSVTDKMTVYVPFEYLRAALPEDGLLDLRNVSTAVLSLLFSDASIGTDKTITAGYVEIETDEYIPDVDAPAQYPMARHEFGYLQENLDATGTKLIDLDYGGNNQYRRLWLYTYNSSAALNSSQIDNIKVRSRNFYYTDIAAEVLQNWQALNYALAVQTGVYVIDFTRNGKNSQRLDARKKTELTLELNSLVSDGTITVVKEKAIYA